MISAKTPIIISVTRKEEEDEFFGLYDSNLITERRNEIINFHSLIMEGIELPGYKSFASQFETASYKEKLTMMSDSLSLEEKKEAIDDIEFIHDDYSNPHNPKAFKNNFIESPYMFSSWKNFPGFYRLKAKAKIEIISKETDFDKFKKLHLSSLVKNIDTISFNSLFRNLDEYVSAYETSIEEDNREDIDEQEKKYFDQEGREDYITEEQYKAISGDSNIVSLMAMGYPYAQIRMDSPTIHDYGPHNDISEWIIGNENGYLSQEFKLPTVYKSFDPHNDNTEHSVRMVNFQDSIAFSNNCPILYGTDPWGSSVMSDIILESPETFQIEVNKKKLLPEYLEFFLNTELGQEYLKFATAEERHGPEIMGFRREITKSELEDMEIPVPTLEEQKKIIESNKRISQVFDTLNETKNNLTYNPINNDKYLNILEDLASAINKLSEGDQLKRLIKGGESVTLEFKEGYIYDFKKSKEKGKTIKSTSLKPRILKNIGSFLNNSEGGILLIGVHDDLSITGMDNEIKEFYKSSYDSFQNSFKDYIVDNLGIPAWHNLEAKFIEVDGKNIYKVECCFSKDTIYIKDHGVEKLPARLGPSSELLEGKKMVEYLKTSNKNRIENLKRNISI